MTNLLKLRSFFHLPIGKDRSKIEILKYNFYIYPPKTHNTLKSLRTAQFILLVFLAFVRPHRACALENYLPGARSLGLSHASVSFSDTWSVFHNQAGTAGLKTFSAGFFFESRFGLDELSLAAVSAVLPYGAGAFGISFLQFGKGVFKENKFGLAYARQLSEKWNAGIQLDYLCQIFPENRRTRGFATFEGGILYHPSEKLHLGVHVFNPVSGGIQAPSGKVKVPAVCRGGGHYRFDETVLVAFEILKDYHNPALYKSGIEFLPAESFTLRFGVSGKPFAHSAGIGYRIGCFSANIAFSYHGNLGITPSVSVQIGSL